MGDAARAIIEAILGPCADSVVEVHRKRITPILEPLRAALREEHEALIEERVDDWPVHLKREPDCAVCALIRGES